MALLTGLLIKGGILGAKKAGAGAAVAKGGGIAAIGGMLMNGAGTAATVASSGVSAAASVAKLGVSVATACVGLVGGAVKCCIYLNDRRKAKKKAKKEEKEKEEMMKNGIIPNYAYQSHYGAPNPNAPQPQESPPQQPPPQPKEEKKATSGNSSISTVFDKRSDEERRKDGGYVEADNQPPPPPPPKPAEEKKKSTMETYKEMTRKPKKETLGHDMDKIKEEVKADKQVQEDAIYKHHRQALVDNCNNDLKKIKAEYKAQKEAYKKSQQGLRGSIPGAGKMAEASMNSLAKKFEDRQEKLERDLAELDKKYGK